ncbi:DUF1003 domain-containing protein [Actinomadura craniellae]|nr:DUF1003 domain-containing protein [Actinomadura craniellae]
MRRTTIMLLVVVPCLFGLSVWTGVGPADDWVRKCQNRQALLDRLEVMEAEVDRLRVAGRSEQEIARLMVPRRNEAAVVEQSGMTNSELAKLRERNRLRYGDPAGPTLQWMWHHHGGNWHNMVEATLDTNEAYDFICSAWFDD